MCPDIKAFGSNGQITQQTRSAIKRTRHKLSNFPKAMAPSAVEIANETQPAVPKSKLHSALPIIDKENARPFDPVLAREAEGVQEDHPAAKVRLLGRWVIIT